MALIHRLAWGLASNTIASQNFFAYLTNQSNIAFVVLLTVAGILALLKLTPLGLQMRAVTQNRRMAGSMGINTARTDMLTFALGSGIAGIAGVALSQIDNVSPNLGQSYIIDSFMVVVFGGVGNLWGTLVSAFALGIANKMLEPVAGAHLPFMAAHRPGRRNWQTHVGKKPREYTLGAGPKHYRGTRQHWLRAGLGGLHLALIHNGLRRRSYE